MIIASFTGIFHNTTGLRSGSASSSGAATCKGSRDGDLLLSAYDRTGLIVERVPPNPRYLLCRYVFLADWNWEVPIFICTRGNPPVQVI